MNINFLFCIVYQYPSQLRSYFLTLPYPQPLKSNPHLPIEVSDHQYQSSSARGNLDCILDEVNDLLPSASRREGAAVELAKL